jgi:4-carboxymuconolactone decarboxylase
MRVPLIAPADLAAEQRPLYEDMRQGILTSFKGFKAPGDDGALIGPWNPWLHFSKFGGPTWELVPVPETAEA